MAIPENAYHKVHRGVDIYIWELPEGGWYWKALDNKQPVNGGMSQDFQRAFEEAKHGSLLMTRLAWAGLWKWDPKLQKSVFTGTPEQWMAYMGYPMPRQAR